MRQYTAGLLLSSSVVLSLSSILLSSLDQRGMGTGVNSLLSLRQYATITTVKLRGTLWLTIRDNTELGFYCRRIVAIVNSTVIVLGSGGYARWWISTVVATVRDNETERDIAVDNTQLGFCCRHIVAIVNAIVIVLGSACYGHWGSLLSLRQ